MGRLLRDETPSMFPDMQKLSRSIRQLPLTTSCVFFCLPHFLGVIREARGKPDREEKVRVISLSLPSLRRAAFLFSSFARPLIPSHYGFVSLKETGSPFFCMSQRSRVSLTRWLGFFLSSLQCIRQDQDVEKRSEG